MKEKNLTKDYLEKQGWEFNFMFGRELEVWSKKSQIILVNKNTRKQETIFNVEDENGGSNGPL